MSIGDIYPWLKAFHVAAALTFVGGVLAVSVFLNASTDAAAARAVRCWDQAVTTPAMLLVWALGLTLALTGNWFADFWLQAKLVLVIVLSGIHGVQSGRLRRLVGGNAVPALRTNYIVLACIVVIAVLAVVKPG